jgi:hypothetical protein
MKVDIPSHQSDGVHDDEKTAVSITSKYGFEPAMGLDIRLA